MSRFNWDDVDTIPEGLWQNIVARAVRGKRGQVALAELEAALLALPEQRLIGGALCHDGAVCAMGALALKRRVDAGEDREQALAALENLEASSVWETIDVGKRMGLCHAMSWEIAVQNDEEFPGVDGEERYAWVLAWVRRSLGGVAA